MRIYGAGKAKTEERNEKNSLNSIVFLGNSAFNFIQEHTRAKKRRENARLEGLKGLKGLDGNGKMDGKTSEKPQRVEQNLETNLERLIVD